jgi:glycosyltransferase involved in cell wall biosynthesis
MKIAHLTPVFPPYESGISTVCFNEAKELARVGHKVTIFTPHYGRKRIQTLSCFSGRGLKVSYLRPLFKYGNAAFVPQVVKRLNKFDIIHLHYPFIGAVESILFGSATKHQPLILTYHNDLKANGLKDKIFKIYNKIFLAKIIQIAKCILISSFEFVPDSQLKDFFPFYRQKFVVLPPGVDSQIFAPRSKRKDLIQKYDIEDDDLVFLFVGVLDKPHFYKGLEIALESLARIKQSFPKIKLLIVGDGDLKNFYINLADNLRLGSRVVFVGQIPHQDLASYYNLADVFLFPSQQPETFGLVVLEAMASSKPIIASDYPALSELVKPEIIGFLFQPGNVQDLTAQILKFLERPSLIQKFGQASRQMIHEDFTWSIHIKKLISIYEELFTLAK